MAGAAGVGGGLVGVVSGDSRPDMFVFTADPANVPPLYDYVYVEVEEVPPGSGEPVPVKVLGQVRGLKRTALGVSPEYPWLVLRNLSVPREADTIVAVARVLGYRWRGGIYYPRRAPQVGSRVYLAPDSLLEEFYSVDERRRLHIGYLISRPSVPAYLDLEGVKRHVAIVAATGAGKTWASVVLIEELLKKGATILVLDPHGEYVALKRSVCRLGPQYCNSVTVLKARRDAEGDIQYRVSVVDMSAEELASVAGVPSRATRIRGVVAGVKEASERLAHALGDPRLAGLKAMCRLLMAAIDSAETARVQGASLERFARELVRRIASRFEGEEREKVEQLAASDEAFNRGLRRIWLSIRRDTEPAYDALRYLEELRRLGVYGVHGVPISSILRPGSVVVFNLAGVRSEVQDHLAYNILSKLFTARVNHVRGVAGDSYPYPVVVVVEEAHRFMPPKSVRQTRTRDVAATIASEGRKFGVFMVAITQRPSRIDPDVLSQLQTQIILRIVNPRDQDAIRDASEQISQDLLENLPGLNTGEAVIVGPMAPAPLMVRLRDRVLDYSGGDIVLVDAWAGSMEEARLVEEYRAEILAKANKLLEADHTELHQALAELANTRWSPEDVEAALRLLARGDNVWASYDPSQAVVYGEAGGHDVRISLGEGRVECSCGSKRPCSHAAAVLMRALLDELITARAAEETDWWRQGLV